MRTMLAVAVAAAIVTLCHAEPPRLIVRGDDMGFSHSGNEALIRCFTDGIETSIEVIVPSPWFPEAVKMLALHPDIDVGVHLALTSEWDNIKWRPVSNAPSLRDADGYFFPMIGPNTNYPGKALKEQSWEIEDVEREFRAQIELAQRKIPRLSHLSCHMGCNRISDEVERLVKRLAREYKIDVDLDALGVERARLKGERGDREHEIQRFMEMLSNLEEDKTYLVVEHPGLDTPELRAIHHIGYEDVAQHRQGVTDVWTSPRVRRHIKSLGIQLISYRDCE